MASEVSDLVYASAGSTTVGSAVDQVSPGSNRRVIAIKIGDKVRFVGYDIA